MEVFLSSFRFALRDPQDVRQERRILSLMPIGCSLSSQSSAVKEAGNMVPKISLA